MKPERRSMTAAIQSAVDLPPEAIALLRRGPPSLCPRTSWWLRQRRNPQHLFQSPNLRSRSSSLQFRLSQLRLSLFSGNLGVVQRVQ